MASDIQNHVNKAGEEAWTHVASDFSKFAHLFQEETEENTEEETSDDSDDDSDDDSEELDVNEKAELKDKYKKTFKNTLVKCKFTKSFNDLSLEEKVKFFTQLSKAWTKNEPNEFMTDKEMEQLNNVVVNPDGDED